MSLGELVCFSDFPYSGWLKQHAVKSNSKVPESPCLVRVPPLGLQMVTILLRPLLIRAGIPPWALRPHGPS